MDITDEDEGKPTPGQGDISPCNDNGDADSVPPMSALNREALRRIIDERGMTPRAVSRALGDNPYLIRDILSGRSRNPRADTIKRIADYLGVTMSHLTDGSPPLANQEEKPLITPRVLVVRYRVQAGYWLEADAFAEPAVRTYPVSPDTRFADHIPQWLEEVVGDSVDRKIPEGGFAHVIDAIELGYAPRHGDFVVVERRRQQGALRERSIKQVRITAGGRVELWPYSTNPRWNQPLTLSDSDASTETEIVGLVVGAYTPFD